MRSGTRGPSRRGYWRSSPPPGFEAYFAELAEAGDPHRRDELAQKYGVTYFSDWIADLTARYKLKLLGL